MQLAQALDLLTAEEIIAALPGVEFSRRALRSKRVLVAEVRELDPVVYPPLVDAATRKQSEREARRAATLKRKRVAERERRVRARLSATAPTVPNAADVDDFLRVPSAADIKAQHAAFLDATSNDALAQSICVVCARELPSTQCSRHEIARLPHRDLLARSDGAYAHAAKHDGLVLVVDHLEHVQSEDGQHTFGQVC